MLGTSRCGDKPAALAGRPTCERRRSSGSIADDHVQLNGMGLKAASDERIGFDFTAT